MTLYDLFSSFVKTMYPEQSYLQSIAEDVEYEELTTELTVYEENKAIH